ncbi:MAG: RIP metalloprotease RseP [FCB group bacterium]|nr:RIP metalloprotease RseP [FCB group bacterium]
MTTLWATILVLGVLIFIHELGHYLAARSVGVRVDRFSIGFPPRLITLTSEKDFWRLKLFFFSREEEQGFAWGPIYETKLSRPGKKGSGTEYCIGLLPVGGYVKMAGMIDESLDATITHSPEELASKHPLAQAWVMSAGVIMNVLLAWVLFSGVALKTGLPEISDEPVIAEFVTGMPAEDSGLKVNDRILAVNGESFSTWQEMSQRIHGLADTDLVLTVQREDEEFELPIHSGSQVVIRDGMKDTLGAIGIYPQVTYLPIGPLKAVQAGMRSTVNSFSMIFTSIKMLVTGEASFKEMGGPIFIAQMAGETARAGWLPLLTFMALISVNLAFLNILPIPGLDGGHILVTMIQVIIRRELSLRVRMVIQQIGMALLLLLMITIVYNDIGRLLGN